MLYRFLMRERQFNQYADTLIPLIIESVALGVVVNLVSDYIGNMLAMDGTTIFILLFLMLAILLLYALFMGQVRDGDDYVQKPTEFGSLLSLTFFIQLLFFDCADVSGFSRWFLVGAGVVPFFLGTGMTGVLDAKFHKFKEDMWRRSSSYRDAQSKPQKSPEPTATASNKPEDDDDRMPRINIRSILEGVADVERQPGILFVIIESILTVQNSVTQLEIFEVCRRLSKKLPSVTFFELIRDLMARFVNVRQSTRKVELITEDRDDWKIVEPKPDWLKNNLEL